MPEHTIAENLTRLQNAKTAIGTAITAKGGTVAAGDGLEEFAADITTIPSGGGGGSQPRKDVNFYDYDGTIINSYTAAEFAELSALPSNPSHEGLTAQGWNWSLSDAKTYVASYGRLNIGQMYASNTTDGKTYLHVRLGEGRLKPYLGLTGNSSGTAVTIDWGDGSTAENVTLDTSTVYTPHVYASNGEYVISIAVTNGTISLNGTSNSTNLFRKSSSETGGGYANILTKAEIGTGVTSIGTNAFQNCYSLTSITIPSSVTSMGTYIFSGCYSLTSITIPSSVTSMGTDIFSGCYSLTSITIPSGVTSISNNAFQNCYSLTSITIPTGVTSIVSSAFSGCYSLTSITIPSGVTSIGYTAFSGCYSLTSVAIPSSVTSIGNGAFSGCYSLSSVTIPSGVSVIGTDIFSGCYSLTSVAIPSSVTSISNNAFQNCYSLTSITIPSGVSVIGTNAFSKAKGLGFIKFSSSTPPAVLAANAWGSVPTDCIIYVPQGSLSDYTSANNYPSSSIYTYVEY